MRRTLGIILFSIIEVAGLAGWLVLADGGQVIVGILVLELGLILEHIVTDNLLHSKPLYSLGSPPLGQIVIFSTLETGIWAIWLLLWSIEPAGGLAGQQMLYWPLIATVFLFAALLVEHTISRNVHERRPIFDRIVEKAVVPHTIVETISCGAWLALVRSMQPIAGVVVLLIGSIVEHIIAVSKTRPG